MPTVVSGTSPLAADFHSRFFTDHDYRRFHARAPRYDSENTFFAEDFAELVDARYLKAPLPKRAIGAVALGQGPEPVPGPAEG